jgi:hypothetical protein
METHIDSATFGSIVVNGKTYDHDILISLEGKVSKRKKRLSKMVFGTSHVISQAEAEYIFEPGTRKLIIGAGHNGMVILSNEAADFFRTRECEVILLPTPEAVDAYNSSPGIFKGLFHVTC